MKKMHFSIIIFLILILIHIEPTLAKETCQTLPEKYGLYIEKGDKQNQYIVIKDNSVACDASKKNSKLKIVAINNKEITNGPTLKKGQYSQKITSDLISQAPKYSLSVTLKDLQTNELINLTYSLTKELPLIGYLPTEVNNNYYDLCAKYREEAASLGQEALTYYQSALNYCFQEKVLKGTNYNTQELTEKITKVEDTWFNYQQENQKMTPDFITNFNYIKEKAQLSSNIIDNGKVSKMPTLKCNYQFLNSSDQTKTYTNSKYNEIINATDEYLNKDYFYTTSSENSGTVTYTYNYAIGNSVKETFDACQKNCEEVVKVEYESPVATKAGQCINYKVKVTSYVQCQNKFLAPAPKQETTYCSPSPTCTDISDVQVKKTQAGPSEDFENCIMNCDGGKYSEECSLTCYDKIYNSKTKEPLLAETNTKKATPLANKLDYSLKECLKDNNDYYGCYGYNGSSINWYSNLNYDQNGNKLTTNWNNKYSLGRWYLDKVFTNTPFSNYNYNNGGYDLSGITDNCSAGYCGTHVADANGFYRINTNGSLCANSCEWNNTACAKNTYLNPGTIIFDYKKNQEAYQTAQNKCLETTQSSTKTSEYIITVNYDSKDTNGKVTVKELIFPNDNSHASAINSPKSNEDTKNTYMSDLNLTGTYINSKTGAISYEPPSKASDWHYENKFCLPLNATTVNAKWLDWATTNKSKYTTKDIEKELLGNNKTSDGFNIKSTIKDFGYYGWTFNVDCFYALKNDPKIAETKLNDYQIKILDRNNLFSESLGFNWTKSAAIPIYKNAKYRVDPEALITEIKNNSQSLYNSDQYLDYKFLLTPEKIKEIRKYNENNNYGEWNGKIIEVNGIRAYQSNLFRGKDAILTEKDGSLIKKGTLGVNNENFIYPE